MPFDVKPIKDGEPTGLIGYTTLSPGSDLRHQGRGGQVDIKFRIHGSVRVDGTPKTVDESGYITVSASDWKGDGLPPQFSKVTYFWPKSSQVMATIAANPSTTNADDLYVGYVVMQDKSQPKSIGLVLTKDKDMAARALAFNGCGGYLIHEKLLGWASTSLTQ